MRSYLQALPAVLGLLLITGCASTSPTVENSPTPDADPNATACTDIEALWGEVEEWGTTEGNTDANGRPPAGATSPDFRVELDAIRQKADGVVRTALDEYYDETPTGDEWWFANGIHRYGYGHQVQAACKSIGTTIDFPS